MLDGWKPQKETDDHAGVIGLSVIQGTGWVVVAV